MVINKAFVLSLDNPLTKEKGFSDIYFTDTNEKNARF